jgi:hypothetical protein
MKFSAEDARRKWPCRGFRSRPVPMVTIAAVLLALSALVEPAMAARKSEGPKGALADEARETPQAAAGLIPLPKPRPADAPSPEAERQAGLPAPSACRLALTEEIAIAPSIPDIHGPGGCGGEDLVRLEAVVLPDKRLVSVKPAAILRCAMASEIADWIRADIAPLAAKLGSVVSDLDNFDSYECRGRNRVLGAPLSEHGLANALDVRSVRFADGGSISLTDRAVSRGLRESVRQTVCARFSTVLGPGSDWYHEDHIHLDLMERRNNYKICQWDVWDPLPRIAPLLPLARPREAPPREVAATPSETPASDNAKSDEDTSEPDEPEAPQTPPSTKKRR